MVSVHVPLRAVGKGNRRGDFGDFFTSLLDSVNWPWSRFIPCAGKQIRPMTLPFQRNSLETPGPACQTYPGPDLASGGLRLTQSPRQNADFAATGSCETHFENKIDELFKRHAKKSPKTHPLLSPPSDTTFAVPQGRDYGKWISTGFFTGLLNLSRSCADKIKELK